MRPDFERARKQAHTECPSANLRLQPSELHVRIINCKVINVYRLSHQVCLNLLQHHQKMNILMEFPKFYFKCVAFSPFLQLKQRTIYINCHGNISSQQQNKNYYPSFMPFSALRNISSSCVMHNQVSLHLLMNALVKLINKIIQI